MSTAIEIPEWLLRPASTPPQPPVDDHRIEGLVNRFIAGKQAALFTAPDAFYRLEGADAVDGAPAFAQRLQALRASTLAQASGEAERTALGPRLDLHIDDAMDGVDRHVARQREVHQRQIIAERQRLILRGAELEHDNDTKIAALAEANASAAVERVRLDGIAPNSPEESGAAQQARSQVLRTAISERIANRKGPQALALFDRVKDDLSPADLQRLNVPIEVARNDEAVDAWLQRERPNLGPPLTERAAAAADLSPDQKAIAAMRVMVHESAHESDRVATVMGLDDQLTAAQRTLATAPPSHKTGTFSKLADAYAAAGEPEKAAAVRRLAIQEPVLRAFSQASPDGQRILINALPAQDRPAAEAMQRAQSEAFARDAFGAGTALYPEVGPPVRIEDIAGRIRQARQIADRRGIPVAPFTAEEIASMRRDRAEGLPVDGDAVLERVSALPADMRSATQAQLERQEVATGADGRPMESAQGARGVAPSVEPPPGSPQFQEADAQTRELTTPSWNDLTLTEQLEVEGRRFLLEGERRGAALRANSTARHVEQGNQLRSESATRELGVYEKIYLFKNRDLPAKLASAVGQLVKAQSKLDQLPGSDAVRRLFEAQSPAEVAALLSKNGGEIARAMGIGSLPTLLVGLVTSAALGPVGGGLVLTGSAGLEGYANGLIGALAEAGVDLTNPAEVVEALQDHAAMAHARDEAASEAKIEMGTTLASMMIGIRRHPKPPKKLTAAQQVIENSKQGKRLEEAIGQKFERDPDLIFRPQITVKPDEGPPVRLDYLTYHRVTKEIDYIDGKSSVPARYTKNQKVSYPEIPKTGSVVVGKGKPPFTGGTRLPAKPVKILGPKDVD